MTIYAVVLFVVTLVGALLSPYPASIVAWGVAIVSALFIAGFVILPRMRD